MLVDNVSDKDGDRRGTREADFASVAKAGEPRSSSDSSDVHRPSGFEARGRATIVDGAGL